MTLNSTVNTICGFGSTHPYECPSCGDTSGTFSLCSRCLSMACCVSRTFGPIYTTDGEEPQTHTGEPKCTPCWWEVRGGVSGAPLYLWPTYVGFRKYLNGGDR